MVISEDPIARSGYEKDPQRSFSEDPTARSSRDMDPLRPVSNDRTNSKKSNRSQDSSIQQKCSVSEQSQKIKFELLVLIIKL